MAKKYNCPILSFDSRQFFKEMSIGTAKPDKDELNQAEHFFIDSHSIDQNYTSGKFEIEALTQLDEIFKTHDTQLNVVLPSKPKMVPPQKTSLGLSEDFDKI